MGKTMGNRIAGVCKCENMPRLTFDSEFLNNQLGRISAPEEIREGQVYDNNVRINEFLIPYTSRIKSIEIRSTAMQGFNGSAVNKSAYYSANFIDTISDIVKKDRFEPQDGSGIEYYTAAEDSDDDTIEKEVQSKRGFDGIKHWAVRVEVLVPMGTVTQTIVALVEFYDGGK